MFKKVIAVLCVVHFALAIESAADDSIQKNFSFSEIYISPDEIDSWIEQFDPEDRANAKLLLSTIDFYSYKRVMNELVVAHGKLLDKLKEQGIALSKVDFSKTYCAKSGDLISYFYRKANKLRGATFQNIEGLTNKSEDRSDRCLVLLDDYIGSGTQFLYGCYGRNHADLFNSYRKVFLVVLVANTKAIQRFELLKEGNEILAQEFARIVCPLDLTPEPEMLEMIRKIPKEKLELIFVKEEKPIVETLSTNQERNEIESLLNKYTRVKYFGGNFAIQGHTVFFYSCPNNLPEILWSPKSLKRDGSSWTPLLHRVEDISIYYGARLFPEEEQVW